MKVSRRQALRMSLATATGLSLGIMDPQEALPQAPQAQPAAPDRLVERPLRNIAPLPLKPDGSAPEYTPKEAGAISEPVLWRYTNGQAPQIEFDYRKMKIRVESRGHAAFTGTLTFADLAPLPRHSYTVLLQCTNQNPRGIVTWTGVRFMDFAKMLGVQSYGHYCRIVASDKFWTEEETTTLMRPQVVLAWLLNGEPIPPKHGAPLRLIIPFRYGARNIKAIEEIAFSAASFPLPTYPPPFPG